MVGLHARADRNRFAGSDLVKAELKRVGFTVSSKFQSAERLRRKIIAFYSSPSIRVAAWRAGPNPTGESLASLEAAVLMDYDPAIFDQPMDQGALEACTEFFDEKMNEGVGNDLALAALPAVHRDLGDWSELPDDRRQTVVLAAFAVATLLNDVRLLRWAAEISDTLAEEFSFAADETMPEPVSEDGITPANEPSTLLAACKALITATNDLEQLAPSATLFDSVAEAAAKVEELRDAVLSNADTARRAALIHEVMESIASHSALVEHLGDQHRQLQSLWEEAYPPRQTDIGALEDRVGEVCRDLPICMADLVHAATAIEEAVRAEAEAKTDRTKSMALRTAADAYDRRDRLWSSAREIILPPGREFCQADDSEGEESGLTNAAGSGQPGQATSDAPAASIEEKSVQPVHTEDASGSDAEEPASGAASACESAPADIKEPPSGSAESVELTGGGQLPKSGKQDPIHSTDSRNAPPQPRTEIDGEIEAVLNAVWNSIGDDRFGIAYHLLDRAEALDGATELPPTSLVAASALGRRISRPGDLIVEQYQEQLEAIEELLPFNGRSQDAAHVLMLEATLRAALFAPRRTSALALLMRLQLSNSLTAIGSFARRWAQRCELLRSTGVDLHRVRTAFQSADRESETHKLEDRIRQSVQHAASRHFSFAPAARVWQRWLHDGPIHDLETLFSEKPSSRYKEVERIVQCFDDPKSFEDLIRDTNIRLQKRTRRTIDDRAVKQIQRGFAPLVHDLRSWLHSVDADQGGPPGFIERTLQELRSDLDDGIGVFEDTIQALSDDGLSALRVALECALRTCKSLYSDFHESERATATNETPADAILSRDLLLVPQIALDFKYHIIGENKDRLLAILSQPNATVSSIKDSFYARLKGDDIVGASLVNEWLSDVGDPSEGECDETLEQSIHELWKSTEQTRQRLVEEVESAYARVQITPETRESLAAFVARPIQKDLRIILDVGERCELVQSELLEQRKASVRGVSQEFEALARELSSEEQEARDAALRDGDLVTARELLGRLKKGQRIAEPAEKRDRFIDFMASVQEIEASMSQPDAPTLDRIDLAAERRELIAGLDFREVAPKAAVIPSRLLDSWYKLRDRTPVSAAEIKVLLEAIGFDDVRVKLNGNATAAIDCIPLADRQLCPLHVYGSEARDRAPAPRGHYEILLSRPQPARPARDALIQLVDASGEHTIVLHFGPLGDDRDELRQWSIQNHRRFLVLDESLLRFLSTIGNGRLRAFFDCTLPFTCVDPFVTTASIVPPEMFYGRAEERANIMAPLGSCFVYGGRQLGKTALLRSAEAEFNRSKSRQRAKWIDLKHNEIGLAKGAADIWPVLWRGLQEIDVIPSDRPEPSGNRGLRNAVGTAIEDWIGDEGRVLLLLDEADAFLMQDARAEFLESTRLKGIMDKTKRRFKVVYSGLHNVLRTTLRANHPLAHLGQAICVGPLLSNGEWQEAHNLVRQPLSAIGCRFKDQRAVLHVLAQTNYYPSLIQLFGAELVRYVRDSKPFPYHLDVNDIANVLKRQAVRDAIRERFLLTLQLDNRYEVIAFAMASYFAEEESALARGLDRDQIFDLVLQFWEEGFRAPDNDSVARSDEHLHFDVLLQEMVGLGVLRRVNEDGGVQQSYTLRNPNILVLLGTKREIGQILDKNWQLPKSFEASSFRANYISQNDAGRRGMLTYEQEARLQDTTVSVVVGSIAARIDELGDFLASRMQPEALRVLRDCPDFNWLERQLTRSRPARDETRVFLVPAESPWGISWLKGAGETLGWLLRGALIRVVFVADPGRLWETLKDIEDNLIEDGQIDWVSAGPWDLTFLRHWCDVQNLGVDTEQINRLMDISGGWPAVLEEYKLPHFERWDKRIQDLDNLVTARRDYFKACLGIDAEAQNQLLKLLEYEAGTESDIEELEQDQDFVVALKRRLRWAERLRLVSLREDVIEFNTLVRRVLLPVVDE